jgi:Putative zinc-finger
MDCAEVQPLLSPFLDGELEGTDRDAVAVHVDQCSECQRRLRELQSLNDVWSSAAPPEPSEQAWKRIGRHLAKLEDGSSRRFRTRRWLAAAILLLVCASGAWAMVHFGGEALSRYFVQARDVVNLVDYLDGQRGRPPGKPVDFDQICSLVPFRTLEAPELPGGYKLQKCCVFCDNIVRYKYARGDSEAILLLYPCGRTVVHGDKQLLTVYLLGKPLKIAQCKLRMSGSWQVNGTAVSLIAPSDLTEFTRLSEYIDGQLSDKN